MLRPVTTLASFGVLLTSTLACDEEVPAPPAGPPACEAPGGTSVTLGGLVDEIGDLSSLHRFPDPWYFTNATTSRDPRSISPGTPRWFSDDDAGHYVAETDTVGRRERVLFEGQGPGVIVRMWSADASGTMRVYLDGAAEPVIEGPMERLLSGEVPPFGPPFAYRDGASSTWVLPIPFARSARVTTDGGELARFHVVSRRYRRSVEVEPFSMEALRRDGCHLERAAARLAAPDREFEDAEREYAPMLPHPVRAARHVFTATPGGSVIRELQIHTAAATPEALRRVRLELSFDGVVTATAPLGDFFGTGPGLDPGTTLPFTVTPDGVLVSRLPMPFRSQAEVALFVQRQHSTRVYTVSAVVAPETWDESRSMYLHADYRPAEAVAPATPRDLTLARVRGRGVLVGLILFAASTGEAWVTGDERLYRDTEGGPSWFGTGAADYFGVDPAARLPRRPLHGVSRADGPGMRGRTVSYRFHTTDRVPFDRDLRLDLEVGLSDEPLEVGAMTYWYGRSASVSELPVLPFDQYRL